MITRYFAIPFSLCIMLFVATSMISKKASIQKQTSDTVSVNAFKLKFKKENGLPIDFKMGMSIASPSNIIININAPYFLGKVDVTLVRGNRPVVSNSYSGIHEVVINKEDFIGYAQAGDRLCVELVSVLKTKEALPIVLDVPVFNIPLN